MIGDIANSVSGEELGINIRALSITADGTVFNASITVQIDTTATLDKVIQAIGKVKGVRNVSRVS